jgi:hypothetical protein
MPELGSVLAPPGWVSLLPDFGNSGHVYCRELDPSGISTRKLSPWNPFEPRSPWRSLVSFGQVSWISEHWSCGLCAKLVFRIGFSTHAALGATVCVDEVCDRTCFLCRNLGRILQRGVRKLRVLKFDS